MRMLHTRTPLFLPQSVLSLIILTCLVLTYGTALTVSPRLSSLAFVSPPRRTAHRRRQRISVPGTNRLKNPWELALSNESSSSCDEEHLIPGVKEIHEESDEELKESEDMAAWDAHDASSDPGMQAASEERAVMLANEMAHKLKEKAQHSDESDENEWNKEHLIQGAKEIHEETDEELKESEDAAVWDAFNSASDPGMEAAMMERSVMLANEIAHKMKEKAEHAHDDDEDNE